MISQTITEIAVGAVAGGAFQGFSEIFKLAQSGLMTIRDMSVSQNEQARANLAEVTKERNAAAGRSSAKLRGTLAIIAFTAAFVFPFVAGIIEVPTSIVERVPGFSALWGVIDFGDKTQVTEANGFVMGPEFWSTVRVIAGFVFGVGGIATGRRFF